MDRPAAERRLAAPVTRGGVDYWTLREAEPVEAREEPAAAQRSPEMKKTDRKIENIIRVALTEACEIAREHYPGFEWLTHFADYDNVPDSLSVVCIYDTNASLANTDRDGVRRLIRETLSSIEIKMKHAQRQVSFDTEENCQNNNGSRWQARFSGPRGKVGNAQSH